jgi:hypothetical protein
MSIDEERSAPVDCLPHFFSFFFHVLVLQYSWLNVLKLRVFLSSSLMKLLNVGSRISEELFNISDCEQYKTIIVNVYWWGTFGSCWLPSAFFLFFLPPSRSLACFNQSLRISKELFNISDCEQLTHDKTNHIH